MEFSPEIKKIIENLSEELIKRACFNEDFSLSFYYDTYLKAGFFVKSKTFQLNTKIYFTSTNLSPYWFDENWDQIKKEICRQVVRKQIEFGFQFLESEDLEDLQVKIDKVLEKR